MISAVTVCSVIDEKLIPNPWIVGDQVWRHTHLIPHMQAFYAADPVSFGEDFYLANPQQFFTLAQYLGLPAVIKGKDGCVASSGEAMLWLTYRLHNEGTDRKLSKHQVFSHAGSNWSPTKCRSIFAAVIAALLVLHNHRISWSSCIANRWQLYAAKINAVIDPVLNDVWAGMNWSVAFLMDGTRRKMSRAQSGPNGEDFQRVDYSGYVHYHNNGYISVTAPDGLFLCFLGPFHGKEPDSKNLQDTALLQQWAAAFPPALGSLVKMITDEGFAHLTASPLVNHFPGGPFPAAQAWRNQYNAALSAARDPVEMPFGAMQQMFPYLLLNQNRTRVSTTVSQNCRVAALLHNVFTTLGVGHQQVGTMFDCDPPTPAAYLA